MTDKITIIGAGGHAKVVLAAAGEAGYEIAAVIDKDAALIGQNILGHLISLQPEVSKETARALAIIAIGDNETRQRLASDFSHFSWVNIIHPRAYVHASAKIGPGALVCAGAIVQPDAVVGAHAIVNTGAIIEHDCVVGDFAHIGPSAVLGGQAVVEEGAFVGLGAKVKPQKKVGAWSIVGVGAAVIGNVAPRAVVAGVPAGPLGDPQSSSE